MSISIREADAEDTNLLVSLIRPAFKMVAERFNLTPVGSQRHPSNCTPGWILTEMADGVRYFILEDGDKPVGCVAIDPANPQVHYIQRLAVLPEHQHLGYGQLLMSRAIDAAREMGAPRVETGILSDNEQLRQWYERRGFEVAATRRFQHLPFEVVFMAKEL